MTWSTIAVPAQSGGKHLAPVRIGCSVRGGRFAQALVITLRPDLMPKPTPAWIGKKRLVTVMLGLGEHEGLLRITPSSGEGFAFRALAGKCVDGVVLRIVGFTPLPQTSQPAKPVTEFDYGDDWMEITLPSWARAQRQSAPTPIATAPKPPFVGLGTQGHAETFAGRRGTSAVW